MHSGKNRMHSKNFRSENILNNFLLPLAVVLIYHLIQEICTGTSSLILFCLFVCFLAAIQSTAQVMRNQLEEEVDIQLMSINPLQINCLTLIFNMVLSLMSATAD